MKPDAITQTQLRDYLLGQVDESQREAIETALLTDDELFEELLAVEDEVIDSYLNDKLSAEARSHFEKHFFATPERLEQLQFARAFDRYVTSNASVPAESEPVPAAPGWFHLYSSPIRVAVFALLLVAIGLGVWQVFFRQSDVDKGLIALNAAYREERSIEARISNLDYAPFSIKRSGQST